MSDLNWILRETGASIVGVSSESVREEGYVSNLLDSNKYTHWVAGTAPQYVIVKLANKHPSLHYVGWDVSQHTTNNIKTIEIAVASSTDLQEQLQEQLIFAHKMRVIMRCEAIPGAGVQLWRLPEPITEDKQYIRFNILSTFDNGAVRLNNLYLLERESSLVGNYNTPIGETLSAKSNIPALGSHECDERLNRENVTTIPSSSIKQASNTANSQGKAVLPFTPSLAASREQSYLNKSNCLEKSAEIAATLPSVAFPRKEELELQQQQQEWQQQQFKSPSRNIDNMIRQDKSAQVNCDNKTNISDACVLQQEETNEKKEETFAQETKLTEPHVSSQTGTSQNNTTMPHRSPSSRIQQLLKDLNDDICMLKPIKIISPRRNLLHYLPENLPEELDNFELGAENELGNYRNGKFVGSELFSRANMQCSPAHDEQPQRQEQEERQLANQRRQKQTANQFDNSQRNNRKHNTINNKHHNNKKNNMDNNNNNNDNKIGKARNSEDEEEKRKTENTHNYLREEKSDNINSDNELEDKEKRQHKKHTQHHRSRHPQRRQSNGNVPDNKSIADNTMVVYMKRIEHLERAVASLTTIVQQQREDLSIIKQALVRQCLQNRHGECINNNSTDNAVDKMNEESKHNAHKNNNNHAYTSTKPPFESIILAPIAANSVDDNSNRDYRGDTKCDRGNKENFTSPTEKLDEQEERTCMLLEHADQQEKSDKELTNAKKIDENEPNSALRHYVRSILNKYLRKEAKKLESASFAKIDDHLHDIIQRISNATNYDVNNLKSNNHINVKIETFPSPSSVSGKLEETPLLNHHTPELVKTEEREQHEYIPVYFRTIPSMQIKDTEEQSEELYM